MSLLSRTEYILKETRSQFKNVGVLWSGGKDSTVLLDIIEKTFHDFPFSVVHLDNGKEFKENYQYMDEIQEKIKFPLITEKIEIKMDSVTGLMCCGHNKTEALQRVIRRENMDAVIVSIRWDEHGIRGMERYFSPRDKEFKWHIFKSETGEAMQDAEFVSWGIVVSDFGDECDHVRIHPLLHWSEYDVWEYIKESKMPINPLYFSKNGKRFRSIGCRECSIAVKSEAKNIDEIVKELQETKTPEREGRLQDKENAMQRLRSLGYM